MKIMLVLLSIALISIAPAADAYAEPEAATVDSVWEAKADTNDDGVVDKYEYKKWKAKHSSYFEDATDVDHAWEAKADTDNDGVVEKAEFKRWVDTHPKLKSYGKHVTKEAAKVDHKWEAKADKNKDGVVGKKEAHKWKSNHRRR